LASASSSKGSKKSTTTTKQKLQTGTISKVITDNFTAKELEELWEQHNQALEELDGPETQNYTRHTSDLIKKLRDVSEKLILAGAIPDVTDRADTASYVWKKLKDNNIPYAKSNFYRYFSPEQKRDWQTEEYLKGEKGGTQKHDHSWQTITQTPMGTLRKCSGTFDSTCSAIMVDGKIYEHTPEEKPEPKPPKPAVPFNEKITPVLQSLEKVADNLIIFARALKNHSLLLNDSEIKKLKGDIFLMKKSGEFLTKTALNKKQIIDPFTMHLLAFAYGEGTQNVAAGIFLLNRLDLAQRRHADGIKKFEKISEFAQLISEKQTKKAMEGKITEINERYEPITEKEAYDQGFSGQKCENCHSMRVGYDRVPNNNYDKTKDPLWMKNETKLICFHCYHLPEKKIFNLPKQQPNPVTIDKQGTN